MNLLSPRRQEAAAAFIAEHARPLDRQLNAFYAGNAPAGAVLDALAAFQNEDGGFGHGLEPDFQLPASSPMATSVALQYCTAVSAPSSHSLVNKALAYLCASYDWEYGFWPSTPPAVNDYPHAPWWHYHPGPPPGEDWPNVSAELAGYLHFYPELVPGDLLAHVTHRAQENLRGKLWDANFYNLFCWERAASFWPEPFKTEIITQITRTYNALLPITPESMGEIRIFWLAPAPQATFASRFPEQTRELLVAEMEQQAADGGWWPTWSWGQYEDIWPMAKREWAGKMTVEALYVYAQFQMLA